MLLEKQRAAFSFVSTWPGAYPLTTLVGSAITFGILAASARPCGTDDCLGVDGWVTVWLALTALLLMANEAPPHLVMLSTTTLLLLLRIIDDAEAWKGFSSSSILTIGVMFVVARAMYTTHAVDKVVLPLLGSPRSHTAAIVQLCLPTSLMSAFLNNTPIVAILLPVCESWAARNGLSTHVLLIPLSFSSILGGMCTLVGTSTNLVLNAQIEADPAAPVEPFELFAMTPVAAPAALVGVLVLAVTAPLLLRPDPSPTPPPVGGTGTPPAASPTTPIQAEPPAHSGRTPEGRSPEAIQAEPPAHSGRTPEGRSPEGRATLAWLCVGIVLTALSLSILGVASLLHLGLLAAFVLVATGCLTVEEAAAAVDVKVWGEGRSCNPKASASLAPASR